MTWLISLFRRTPESDPYGISAALTLRKQVRLAGLARPYRRRK